MAGYIELTNGSIWYDEQGQGEALVLLHGGAVDARFFEHNVAPLAEHYRVITTDLWGHGRTADRAGPFTLESFATDVAELIERVAGRAGARARSQHRRGGGAHACAAASRARPEADRDQRRL